MSVTHDADACPLCGETRARLLYALEPADGTQRRAVRCLSCTFVYMSPRLTEAFLNTYYSGAGVYAYSSTEASDYATVIADRTRLIGAMLEKVPGAPKNGLGVDFGAGVGTTVKALSDLGFDAMGIEISARSRDAARGLFNLDMCDGDLGQLSNESVAVLTCFDVLEHLLNPAGFIEHVHKALIPGGTVVFGVPNFDALDRLLTGPKARAMIFPEHVNYFSKTTLKALFAQSGFDVRYVGSPPPYGVAISFGLRAAVVRLLGRNAFSLGVRSALTWLKKYLVYPLPNAFVESTGLFGQSLLLVARKCGTEMG